MSASPLILWFRDDLRVTDHPALHAAAKSGRPIIALYILETDEPDYRAPGAASRWWLAGSLRAHAKRLKALGLTLSLKAGHALAVLPALAAECGAGSVFWTRRYGRAERIDKAIAGKLRQGGIEVRVFRGSLLHEPEDIRTGDGGAFRVFSPFFRAAGQKAGPELPLPAPGRLAGVAGIESERLEDWQLEPRHPDWAADMGEHWTRGEEGAGQRLSQFIERGLNGYAEGRDRPDQEHVSRLSPHLRFGEISPRQVRHAASAALSRKSGPASRDVEKFIAELYWREFSYHLLHEHPDLGSKNFQPRFDAFPWREDRHAIAAWQRGTTGYPMVDAGMRQLWRTGWMHNRVRMIVASFLVKHLLIDWRAGEAWFWDTLVDADPASNTASWQWVAGSGADAAPYFRIFNPVTQGQKFDPSGRYVRSFVPEIEGLPDADIHAPWKASLLDLKSAGVTLGKTYPAPFVDHALARERALAAFGRTQKNAGATAT
jgi:deoxyribodipyrimidine photo-lyase